MRLILGLDRPTAGDVTVNGKRYRDHAAPLREVGALLEARAVHTGRSALQPPARARADPRHPAQPRRRADRHGRSARRRAKRAGQFSLGMGQRLGIATALLGDPHTLLLDEPVNGLDPEGIHWIRTLLQRLAAEGRTVFVSSHLMSEMALTADHLIVIGRGRLIADIERRRVRPPRVKKGVRVRTPQATRLRELLAGPDVTVDGARDGPARRAGLTARADRRGRRGERHRAPRADAAAGIARGGVHGADPGRGRVPGAACPQPAEAAA